MPTTGTKMRTFRMKEEAWEQMIEVIEGRNGRVREKPWSISDFIGIAIREKVLKMQRGRQGFQDGAADRLDDFEIGK